MAVLTEAQVTEALRSYTEWKLEAGEIVRRLEFPDFVKAMAFVNRVADKAETAGHHPDIDIRYNKVRLALISHDAGGLTSRDFKLAAEIDRLL